MKEIPVKYKNEVHVALVDDELYVKLSKFKWHTSLRNGKVSYARTVGMGKSISMHHLVIGKKKGFDIDHINGNKLDNRKENLRHCTRSQNMMNVPKYGNGKSGHRGVCWVTRDRKWMAYIAVNYKQKTIGLFKDKDEAVKARKKAETQYHREFSYLDETKL